MKHLKLILIILIVAGVCAAAAYYVSARNRSFTADESVAFSDSQGRINGTLEKLDAAKGTASLRLDDGSARTVRLRKDTFVLVNGRTSAARSLRTGVQVSVLITDGETADYIMQGSWQCPRDGRLPRSKNPAELQCPWKKN